MGGLTAISGNAFLDAFRQAQNRGGMDRSWMRCHDFSASLPRIVDREEIGGKNAEHIFPTLSSSVLSLITLALSIHGTHIQWRNDKEENNKTIVCDDRPVR